MTTVEVRNLRWIGVITWLVVGLPSATWLIENHQIATPSGIAWTAFILLFVVFLRGEALPLCPTGAKVWLIAAQTVCVLGGIYARPDVGAKFQPILFVIIAGQLGRFPARVAFTWIAVQTALYGAIIWRDHDSVVAVVAAYAVFQLFAVISVQIAHRELAARQQLAAANAELKVATGLLDLSSRTSERLRIARDLHDLLGHHLTALSLNLEVASHLANGEAREAIDKSRSIAKNLLGDVRDVVSRLRDDEPADLGSALQSLKEVITVPALHLDVSPAIVVRDSATAQVALRAVQEIVTNAVKHSNARNLWLTVAQNDGTLSINARDDGDGSDHVVLGNGLRGMRERVEEAKGSIEISSMRGKGFSVEVRLPL